MFYRRSHASAGLVLLTAVGVLSGCHRAQTASAPPPPPEVSVATVQRASVPITVDLPGRTNAYYVAQVRARGALEALGLVG